MTIRFIGYVSYPCKQMFCVHGQRCMLLLMVKPCQWTSLYVALELNWQQPKSTAGQWRGCFNPLIILAVSRAERRRNCRAFPADARKMLTHWIRQCIFAQTSHPGMKEGLCCFCISVSVVKLKHAQLTLKLSTSAESFDIFHSKVASCSRVGKNRNFFSGYQVLMPSVLEFLGLRRPGTIQDRLCKICQNSSNIGFCMHHPKPVDQALMLMCTKLSTTGEFPHTMNNYPNIHTLPTQQKYISVESFICMMHGSSLLYWLLLVSSQLKQKGCFVQIVALFSVYLPRVWFSLRSSQGCNDVVVFDFSADCLPQRWLTISDHLPIFILFPYSPVRYMPLYVYHSFQRHLTGRFTKNIFTVCQGITSPEFQLCHIDFVRGQVPFPQVLVYLGMVPWQCPDKCLGKKRSQRPHLIHLWDLQTNTRPVDERVFKEHSTKSQAASTAKGHYLCSCSGVAEMGLC